MNFYQKKVFLTLLFLVGIALSFWLGSRYPQLNTKAMMGVDSPSMGISFDMVKEVSEEDSDFRKIIYNTINWIDTNKKGMTFGFLFGAVFILLFSLLKEVQIKNRFLNTALGAVIGAPLGVCVNCAAPIAKGMKDAGAKTETALATMITSPTMNVIVLSMLFSFLPFYMVWLKIGFTLLFIFAFIPALAYFFRENSNTVIAPIPAKVPAFNLPHDSTDKMVSSSWTKAMRWVGSSYLKSLWFIVKTTLPLMVLAGLLGNIVITFFPLEEIVDLVKGLSFTEKVIYMGIIAVIATFLPVPIAFDVIITAMLWSSGLHTRYAMVLLFCLGTFSIYSSFIVAKSFSFKLAVALFLVTAFLGFSAGISGHYLEKNVGRKYRMEHYNQLKNSDSTPAYIIADKTKEGIGSEEIEKLSIERNKREIFKVDNTTLYQSEFNTNNSKRIVFKSIEGGKAGLDIPYRFSVEETFEPFANQRSIAAGDIHNDGYTDLLFSSAGELLLFANVNGEKFMRQTLSFPVDRKVLNAALVDFNNDGWLDVFVSTFNDGNYILQNLDGDLSKNQVIRLPQLKHTVFSHAAAFGDINHDGLIDIVLGNWTVGVINAGYSMEASRNFYLLNEGDFQFNIKNLTGADGETLSVLLADFTGDGVADLISGNDFNMEDQYYTGNKESGEFSYISEPQKILEKSTVTTMSVTTADIDNDLVSEIYQVSVGRLNGNNKTRDITKICEIISDEYDKKICEQVFERQQNILSSGLGKDFEICPEEYRNDCIVAELVKNFKKSDLTNHPKNYLPEGWKLIRTLSELAQDNNQTVEIPKGTYHERRAGGVLLKKERNGTFKSVGDKYGLSRTGWSWNAKFGDFDNDEWQDVLVANGFLFNPTQESNILYKNVEGKKFVEVTEKMNMVNYLPASSYTYLDYDLDGDLDIVLCTSIGPVYLYENLHHQHHSVAFSITDEIGNRSGVGATVTIYYGDNKHQKREIVLSGGYKSYDETKVYFGLGEHEEIKKVTVDWTVGPQTVLEKTLAADSHYQIVRKKQLQ